MMDRPTNEQFEAMRETLRGWAKLARTWQRSRLSLRDKIDAGRLVTALGEADHELLIQTLVFETFAKDIER